jgi:hypothetical protein
MKKKIETKLSLTKEILRNLSQRDLQEVVGGATFTTFCCSGGASSCCTDSCRIC